MIHKIIFYTCIMLLLFGCVERAYYVSPGYGNATPYHTLPLLKDSIKSSLYFNGSLLSGVANDNLRDEQYALNANIYNANSFSMFKAWYGGGVTLGDYVVKSCDCDEPVMTYIDSKAGAKFYGSLNANGGIAFTLPLGKSEWRIIGVQASLQQEFGSYLQFRKNILKDSVAVDGNTTNARLPSIGFSTELAFNLNHNSALNLFMQFTSLMGKQYRYYDDADDIDNSGSNIKLRRYAYITNTIALSKKKFTGYLQTNIGTRMQNVQAGINYRLSKHIKTRNAVQND